MLVEKDKAAGKDFNTKRRDEMVRAQHNFAGMRKVERQNYEAALAEQRAQEKLLTTTALEEPAKKDKALMTQDEIFREQIDEKSAQRKAEMVQRQLNRNTLTRKNMEQRRERGERYAMFAEEFGDVFENIFDKEFKAASKA